MPRLINPDAGTVVHLEGDLEAVYRARGWVDADVSSRAAEAAPVKPPVKRGRPKKVADPKE